jgi:hypothetical protein
LADKLRVPLFEVLVDLFAGLRRPESPHARRRRTKSGSTQNAPVRPCPTD